MKAGMVEEAVMSLEEGLKVHPAYMSARVLLGKAYYEKGDTENACAQFEMVVKAVPDNLYANRRLGEIYCSQGRIPDAIKAYRMVSLLNPKDEEVRQLLDDLQAGKMPVAAAPPPAQKMTVESHMAEKAEVKAPAAAAPAAAAPPIEAPAEESEEPDSGSKIYDLSEMEEPAQLEEATYEGAVSGGSVPQQPSFMEMPVPEMDTLQQVKQAMPAEPSILDEMESVQGPPEPVDYMAAMEAESPAVEPMFADDAAEPIELASPSDFIAPLEVETPAEEPMFLEDASPFEEAVPFEEAAPFEAAEAFDASAEPFELASPSDFIEPMQADTPIEEPMFLEEASPFEEAAPFEAAEKPKGKPGGYAVDLSMMAESGLDDIFASDKAAAVEETGAVRDDVYELGDDVSGSDISGLKIETPVIEKKEPVQQAEAPSKDAFETETLAELYITQGFYDRAINIYKTLLVEQPDNIILKQKLEDLYLLAGMSAKAASKAEVAREPRPVYEPVDFDAPMEEEAVFDATPVAEESPVFDEAQVFEAEPVFDETPAFDAVPVFDETPVGMFAEEAEAIEVEQPSFTEERPAARKPQVDARAVNRLEMFLDNIRRKGTK